MMTKVEVRNTLGTLVHTMPVMEATPESPYLIKEITGLGPVKAEITTSPFAGQDGGYFQSARVGGRSLGLKIKYKPNYGINGTIEGLRRELYGKFPPKATIGLRFYNDTYSTVEIQGIVEDHVPEIFEKEPHVTVVIFCAKPNFAELTTLEQSGPSSADIIMPYSGTADVGFRLRMNVADPFKKFTFRNYIDPDLTFDFTGSTLSPDFLDQLDISTVPGNKYARLTRFVPPPTTTVNNILQYITAGSLDMRLGPATTKIRADLYDVSEGPVGIGSNGITWICTPAYVGL